MKQWVIIIFCSRLFILFFFFFCKSLHSSWGAIIDALVIIMKVYIWTHDQIMGHDPSCVLMNLIKFQHPLLGLP